MLGALLYGVAPADPLAFGGVTIVLAATAYAACRIPAYRLSRLNPLAVLHED
jgi:ABC-type lipoprotein release transport system permease subunit